MFKVGDKVAWSHAVGPKHTASSVMKAEAVQADDPDAQIGVIVEPETPQPASWFAVQLESGETRVLTADELVRVE